MYPKLLEHLKAHRAAPPGEIDNVLKSAAATLRQLTNLLRPMSAPARREALDLIAEEVIDRVTPPANLIGPDGKHTAEFVEWSRRTFDLEEHLEGMRQIEEGRGGGIEDILRGFESEGKRDERVA